MSYPSISFFKPYKITKMMVSSSTYIYTDDATTFIMSGMQSMRCCVYTITLGSLNPLDWNPIVHNLMGQFQSHGITAHPGYGVGNLRAKDRNIAFI